MTRYIDPDITQGVNIGFTAIVIVPLITIMCITLARAPRSKDPARVTTTYFKVMLPFAILWPILYMIQGILSMVYNRGNLDAEIVYHAQLRISALSTLFSYFTDILLIMTLVEMGNGFLFCLAQTRTGLQKAMRYTAITTCAILAILAIAQFGVYNAEYSQYLSGMWYGIDDALYEASRKLGIALNFLTFFWALALLVFAVIVFQKSKRNYVLKNSAMLFLIAAVLNFITHLYMLFYISIFVLSNFYAYDNYYETYTALMFVDPIITAWIFVAAVSLVCAIVIRKHNGLWTTLQPWMDAQGPPALAANPSYKGPGEQWHQPSDRYVVGV